MDSQSFDKPKKLRTVRKIKCGTDKFILVRNTRVHYVEAGQGETVLLLPGSESTFRIWNRVMPLLAQKYRVLALDYPRITEVGASDQSANAKLGEVADLIAQMVRQMKLEKVSLVGISLAGAISLDFASRYPELVDKVVSIGGHITQLHTKKGSLRKSLKRFGIVHDASIDIEEEAKAIKSPVLYIYGSQTNLREIPLKENLEFLQTYLPQAWIAAVEGGIFELAMQKPEDLSSLIAEFLSKK